MITEAHIGIGIKGVEGREAAKASDIAICEYQLLRRLIFYHGLETYRKNSDFILFTFYKNLAYNLPVFWFGFYCGFSG